jgi:hydroxyacylglutathione hydrolase
MLLKIFYNPDLSHASYLVASPDSGEAVVIDPSRDIEEYLEFAEQNNLRIIGAVETHIHADFASGGHELAHAVKGTMFVSNYGGDQGYELEIASDVHVRYLRDGDEIYLSKVTLKAMHTPGHTPEHLCFMLTDAEAGQPFALFSGDCLFAGDMGRPDLLETAVGVTESAQEGARGQFANTKRFREMPDHLLVLPAHRAGSACGKALGDVPATTLGYEKLTNPAFQFEDEATEAAEAAFVEWLLEAQSEVPHYFSQMKRINQEGADLLETLVFPRPIIYDSEVTIAARALLIDTRPRDSFSTAHIPGSINIPLSDTGFVKWLGWLVDYDRPTYIVVDEANLNEAVRKLHSIGIDQIGGYVRPQTAMRYRAYTRQIQPEAAALEQANGALILDVRSQSERDESYIPGSRHIPLGEVEERLYELPRDQQIITQCGTGVRSQIAATLLQKHNFARVTNMDGGIDDWKRAGLPLEHPDKIRETQ